MIEPDDAIDSRIKDALDSVYTALPCHVVRVDLQLRQVDVQPLIRTRVYNQTDQQVDKSHPQIVNCPICFLGDADVDFSFTVRAGNQNKLGTQGIVLFSMESLDDYLTTGSESGPYELDRHGAHSGWFLPCGLSFAVVANSTPIPTNGARMMINTPIGPLGVELDRDTNNGLVTAPNQLILRAGNQLILDAPDVQTTGTFTEGQES